MYYPQLVTASNLEKNSPNEEARVSACCGADVPRLLLQSGAAQFPVEQIFPSASTQTSVLRLCVTQRILLILKLLRR
jgi:hypothetical protein